MTLDEISRHPLLTDDERAMCRAMLASSTRGVRNQTVVPGFSFLDFADVCLRATARDYAEAHEESESWFAHRALRRASLVHAWEVLRDAVPNSCTTPLRVQDALDLLAEQVESIDAEAARRQRARDAWALRHAPQSFTAKTARRRVPRAK